MTTSTKIRTDDAAAGQARLPDRLRRIRPPRGRSMHAALIALYVLGGFYITARLWAGVSHNVTAHNIDDYAQFQFFFSHAAQSLVNLDNPFFTSAVNAPFGVNMMANTSMLGLSIPLAPVTLLLGPKVSFALTLVIGFAGTAAAWYYFFLKHITKNPLVAFGGGLLAGFAPGMVSQANGHPNIVAQFMLPLIVSRVIQMKEPGRAVRNGVILGLMCVYQMFLNEELLMQTALVCVVLTIVYAISRPSDIRVSWRPFAGAGLVAVAVAVVVMAYPLWFQFFGPQHYNGPFDWAGNYPTDLASYPAYSSESLGGPRNVRFHPLAPNAEEENAFLGWPLCLAAAGFAVFYRKVMAVRLASAAAIFLGLLSLGDTIRINTYDTGVPGPWRLVSSLPLFDSVIVTRMALGVMPAVAVIVAIAADRVIAAIKASEPSARRPLIALATVALATIAIPITPTPLPVTGHTPVPPMFANGQWRQYVDEGGTVMPVPTHAFATDALYWVVESDMTVPLAGGYFIGPRNENDPTAQFGRDQRFLGKLLNTAEEKGVKPVLTEADRQRALADLKYWKVDLVVLTPQPQFDVLKATMIDMLGQPGQSVEGAWVWDVRSLS